MNPQYEILANCLLPEHMLEWFDLTNVEVRPKEKKANQEQQSEEYSPNVIHLYLDENELTPDNREDLRPNGFSSIIVFRPINEKKFPKSLVVRDNMPIFAARNPPRVENTEARPPLKRWAYFLKRQKQTRYG